METKPEKDIKHHEMDIYRELSSIKIHQISKKGLDYERYFKNRCIKGFLQRRVLQKKMDKKIKAYEFDSEVSNAKGSVTEELTKLFPANQDWANTGVIATTKNKEFLDLMTEYLNKKVDNVQSKSVRNIHRIQSPSLYRKYEVSPELLQYLHKIKNKIPPSCLYNPNYNSITPHVPYTKLQPIKISKDKNKEQIQRIFSSVTTKSSNVATIEKNQNAFDTKIKSNQLKDRIRLLREKKSHVMSFEKYSSRNDIFSKAAYKDSMLEPLKLSRKVCSPIFRKMSPRYREKVPNRVPVLIDYSPNYNLLYNRNNSYRKEKRIEGSSTYKRKPIRKIWSSFQATSDYQSVPNF